MAGVTVNNVTRNIKVSTTPTQITVRSVTNNFQVVTVGRRGPRGETGQGVPTGGSTGQALVKTSGLDFATGWETISSGAVDSVNGQIGIVVLDQDDISNGTTYKQYSQTEKTKLAGIETGADVTDTANVTTAGALMDSEVTNLAQVKAFDETDYATAAQGTLADSAVQDLSDLGITADATELNYVDGVTSAVQTQIDAKVTGAASSTDNAIARFDSTTGKLVQDSTTTLDDSGRLFLPQGSNIRLGTTTEGASLVYLSGTHTSTGVSAYVLRVSTAAPATATGAYSTFLLEPSTVAGSYNITAASGMRMGIPNLGAGMTISTMDGVFIRNQGSSQVTDAYGIRIEPQSGATNNYGAAIAAAGTAALWLSNTTNPTNEAGGIVFGSSKDTNLYRSAANTLKTDDTLHVGGNLGAGITPIYGLHVLSNTADAFMAYLSQTKTAANTIVALENSAASATTNGVGFDLRANSSTTTRTIARIVASLSDTTDATRTSKFGWFTNVSGAFTESFTMLGNSFGIRNTNPSEALDVTGNIAVSGTVDGVDIASLAEDVDLKVPYTGATDAVDLGAYSLTAGGVISAGDVTTIGGAGITLDDGGTPTQFYNPGVNGELAFKDPMGGNAAVLDPNSLTADRTFTLPDDTGTVALTSDIPDTATYGKGFIEHGATAGTARPTGFASVEWHGSVEPTNAINGDTWIQT